MPGNPKKNDLIARLKEVLDIEMVEDVDMSAVIENEAEDLITQTLQELSNEPVHEKPLPKPIQVQRSLPASPVKELVAADAKELDSAGDSSGNESPKKVIILNSNKDEALAARAARFGITAAATVAPTSKTAKLDAMKKRGQKFGANVSTELKKIEVEEKKAERAQRFQSGSASTKVDVSDEKLAQRRARFGEVVPEPKVAKNGKKEEVSITVGVKRKSIVSPEDEAKALKRKERFGLSA